ncbi:MAG TPA: GNVR domain-containing protein, partial [Gemmatimonadaceae bacterium]
SGNNPADSLDKGLERVNNLISVGVDNQTSIVTLSVDARYPVLAAAVANRLIDYLNDFNTRRRQSQARERRKFIERRIEDGQRELRSAEEDLRTFYERNRSWQQSPQLGFEEGRLRRQVDLRQQVFLTLSREYETARIEEVNDTPVITVIDAAVPPPERSKPRRKVIVLLALCLGGILGVSWALGAEYIDRLRHEEETEYAKLTATLQQARQDVFHGFGTRPGRRDRSAGRSGEDEL